MISEGTTVAQPMSNLRKVFLSGLAGGSASILTDLIYFPLDTIKTRIQASGRNNIDYSEKAKAISKFRGLVPTMAISFPAAFGFFFGYEGGKDLAVKALGFGDGPFAHMFAAACGESCASLVRNPSEVIKQQMQIGLDATTRETAREIYKLKGFRGFYAGLGSLILREIPFSSLEFPAYEFLRKKSLEFSGEKIPTPLQNTINGALAAAFAGFLTTPIDVAKTRIMTQRDSYYKNTFDCLVKIAKEEKISKLFSAAHIRTFNLAIGGVIFFNSYEFFKKIYLPVH